MSRQPPLPPGLPPRPNGNQRSDNRNSYRPAYEQDRDDRGDLFSNRSRDGFRPRSPPPTYEFRGNSNNYDSRSDDRRYPTRYEDRAPGTSAPRGYQSDTYRPREEAAQNFTFRQNPPPSIDFRAADNYRKSPPRQRGRQDNGKQPRTFNGNQRGRGGYRGRGGPQLASERKFLQGNRAPTPELMQGMDEDENHGARYKPIEDLSDSDEAEMDLSDSDNLAASQPKKKQARSHGKAADGDSVPKWSNPDPYTALPPPDAEKKKDMVKLIRKARVATGLEGTNKTEAVSDDFISFDFGNDAAEEEEEDAYEPPLPVVTAPQGPRLANSSAPLRPSQSDSMRPQGSLNQVMPNDMTVGNTAAAPVGTQSAIQSTMQNGNANGRAPMMIDSTSDSPPLSRKPALGRAPAPVESGPSNPQLGSRKRNARDEIKAAPRIHESSRGKKQASDGLIVAQWRPVKDRSPTPWVQIDHSDTAKMGFWLHKEIMDFYHFVKPQAFEQVIREKLIEDLNSRVQHSYQDADVLSFGSFPAGLYLPTADMDLVMVSDNFMHNGRKMYGQNNHFFNGFRRFLTQSNLPMQQTIDVISKARVPLVKYVDKLTGLKVDISFENDTGLIANKTFQEWKAQYPAMPMIVTVIKHLLAMRGLNEPVNGGIGGFSVICLVVSLLQHMPQVQSRNMIPEHHLGEILMEFFNLYGNEFNTVTTGIQLKPPGYFSKSHANVPYKGQAEKFMIIDPNKSDNDISGGSSNTKAIIKCFSESYRALQETMANLQHSPNRSGQSILGCILGGNYESFKLQRDHLRHIHETLLGPVQSS